MTTLISLVGNVAHAVLPLLPRIVIQIGAAAVPPFALLAAVHGIALAVRVGASGTVCRWAVSAVAAIGLGAFVVSFLALRDLMQVIGYSAATAWIFPAIIDTAVALSTLMLVALADKPARRTGTVTTSANTQTPAPQRLSQPPTQSAKTHVTRFAPASARAQTAQAEGAQTAVSVQRDAAQTVQDPAQIESTQVDADLASELIASGVTTQRVETVIAVLAASRAGRRSTLPPRHRGSTTGPRSGSWRPPGSTGSASSWWSADGSRDPERASMRPNKRFDFNATGNDRPTQGC